MLRLMRDNYEQGLYEGEEYQYWQKVNALKEKLGLLNRVPETAINKAAQTLLDLRKTWEERKQLVHLMIQEVGCDVESKCLKWVKVRPDYDALFSLLNGLRLDAERHFQIERLEAQGDNQDNKEDIGQIVTEVKIQLPMSHNVLTIVEEYVLGRVCTLKAGSPSCH